MAQLTFRQGMVRRQTDTAGNPSFLLKNGSYVDLIVSPDPTVITFAHFTADYLYDELLTVSQAWGPFTGGIDAWMYWDVDLSTGELSRGITTVQPITRSTAPAFPIALDQHWFDTLTSVMKVWNGSRWVEKIRVFAAKMASGSTIIPYELGSQIAVNRKVYAGHVLFDETDTPLKIFKTLQQFEFITTETPMASQFHRLMNFRLETTINQATPQEHIPIFHAIAYYDTNTIGLARSTDPSHPAIGISSEDMVTGAGPFAFMTKGFVTYDQWNWTQAPGTRLFVGATGEITASVSQTNSSQQIATVVDEQTIFVDVQQIIRYA